MTETPDLQTSCAARRSNRRAPRGLLIAGLFATLALAACGKKDQGQGAPGGTGGPQQALPVTVIEAAPKRVPITVDTVGQSEGSKEVQVRARVSGILLKQRFSEGDRVKRDAILYQIDPAPYEIALAQARAALAQAQATLEQSTREEARLKPLVTEQAISGKEFDEAGSTRKTSAANVMAKEADVRNAELNLSYTKVAAPIGGVSGRNISSEGSLVTAGTDSALLTTIVQTDPIWVRFSISEAEYATLRNGNDQNAKVELIGSDGKNLLSPGKLNFAASTVDRTLGTVQLRAEVPNAGLRILPGQFVRTRLFVGEVEGVLVPQAAVMTSDNGKAVMMVGADNKVTSHPVDAGAWQGDQWVIRQGLSQGDKVIVDNLVKVRPGMTVAPHPPQAAGALGQGAPAGQQAPAQSGGVASKTDPAKTDAPKTDAKQ